MCAGCAGPLPGDHRFHRELRNTAIPDPKSDEWLELVMFPKSKTDKGAHLPGRGSGRSSLVTSTQRVKLEYLHVLRLLSM